MFLKQCTHVSRLELNLRGSLSGIILSEREFFHIYSKVKANDPLFNPLAKISVIFHLLGSCLLPRSRLICQLKYIIRRDQVGSLLFHSWDWRTIGYVPWIHQVLLRILFFSLHACLLVVLSLSSQVWNVNLKVMTWHNFKGQNETVFQVPWSKRERWW